MPEWHFKDNAEPQGSSDGFWYDVTETGRIKFAEVLSQPEQVAKIKAAIEVVASFERAMMGAGLINEF